MQASCQQPEPALCPEGHSAAEVLQGKCDRFLSIGQTCRCDLAPKSLGQPCPCALVSSWN